MPFLKVNDMKEFATTIENPVLATSVPDSYAYLNMLRTQDNKPVHYERRGSMAGGNGGIIDCYILSFNNTELKIYINPYAKENSTDAPRGLKLFKGASNIAKLRMLAEQGDAEAMEELGYLYFNGDGVQQNDYEAFQWFQKAAQHGIVEAYFYLGLIYSDGKVVPQDYVKALKYYKISAEHGEAAAETNIGLMYSKGRGVKQNYAEAVKWYRKAAEKGYAAAQNNLGEMYAHGRGVEQDISQAIKWFTLAAKQGFRQAQIALDYFNKGD